MTTRKKTEPVDETEETDEEPKGEQTAQGDGGQSDHSDSLDGRIRTMVREAVESLVGDGHKPGARATQADDEDRLSRLVRDAQLKLKAEEEKDSRFKKVEETLEKLVEKPPARDGVLGKLQRFMWGSE